jgi:hypothetical protein
MNRDPFHALGALPAMAGAAALTLALLAQAADTVPAKPLLPSKPAVAGAPASAAKATANRPRPNTRALGGDDDLKDLEVERVRGKNR